MGNPDYCPPIQTPGKTDGLQSSCICRRGRRKQPSRYGRRASTRLRGPLIFPAGDSRRSTRSKRSGRMKFGLFGGARARGGPAGDSDGYHHFINYVIEAERLGFSSVFLVEHHFTGFGQVSASLNLLSYLAARTERIRLGTAVVVLPWHNPVLVAEAAATLDLLSNGRLDFGVGKGYRPYEFSGFCIPQDEATARFDEAIEVIRRAWTSQAGFPTRAAGGTTTTSWSTRRRFSSRTRPAGSVREAPSRSAAPRARATTCCWIRSRRST